MRDKGLVGIQDGFLGERFYTLSQFSLLRGSLCGSFARCARFLSLTDCAALQSWRSWGFISAGAHQSPSDPSPACIGCSTTAGGVDLFFVLSGFLITSILLNTADSPDYFKSFYMRRVLRIFPLYFLMVGLFFYVELPLLERHFGMHSSVRSEQLWYWTYLSNWHDPNDRPIAALNHFWSLAIEEQFYLVWPLAIWFCAKKNEAKRALILCIASIGIATIARAVLELRGASWEFLHRNTLTRFDALAFGGLLALVARNVELSEKVRSWIGYAALGLTGLFVVNEWVGPSRSLFFYTLRYGLSPLILGSLVFYAFAESGTSGVWARISRSAPLRAIGKYSYAMYVFHLVAVRYAMEPLVNFGVRAGLPLSVSLVLAMVISGFGIFALGVLSWYGFEKHFLKLKEKFSYEVAPAGVAAGATASTSP